MALFDDTSNIHAQESAKGKYVSVTSKEMMLDVESVIAKYKEALKINGLMIL